MSGCGQGCGRGRGRPPGRARGARGLGDQGSNAAQGQDAPVPAVVRGRGRPRKNPHDANGNATQHNPPPAAGGLDDCHDFLVVVGQRFSWEL